MAIIEVIGSFVAATVAVTIAVVFVFCEVGVAILFVLWLAMGPMMFDGVGAVLGCLIVLALLVSFAAGAGIGIYLFVGWLAG